MNQIFNAPKASASPPQERELIARLVEAQDALTRLHASSQATLAEIRSAASVHSLGTSSWTDEELKHVFQASTHRGTRLHSIWKAFRNRHLIRHSGLYDKDWYLARYADVPNSAISPDFHFLLFGIHEGRDPGPSFSQIKYALFYKDVLLSQANPLLHYVCHGKAEGRIPFVVEQ